jgi:hypothetical protein
LLPAPGQALCAVAAGVPPVRVTLSGVGKYPYIRASERVVDFGAVLVGRSVERSLALQNATPAAAAFTLRRADEAPGAHDGVFTAAPSSGRLPGWGSAPLRVEYTPSAPGVFSTEAFRVATPGGAPSTLTLRGTALGPTVTASASALSFGFVSLDDALTAPPKYLQLDNASDLPVSYECDAGGAGGGVFECVPAAGSLPPRAFVQVAISFRPSAAANYHRRLTVLLEHAPPLAVDLAGAGFTPKARPPALPTGVLAAHRGAGGAPTPATPVLPPPRDVCAEYISGDAACGIALDARELDFGACGAMRPPEVRVVTVQNRTGKTMELFWHKSPVDAAAAAAAAAPPASLSATGARLARTGTASSAASAAASTASAFVVSPDALELEPHGVAVFRVSFRPGRANTAYGSRLELHAHWKAQRSWRLGEGEERSLAPPWSVSLRCAGHSYTSANAAAASAPPPPLALSQRRLAFLPVPPGGAAYRTLVLRLADSAPEPLAWALSPPPPEDDEGDDACPFAVRPAAGVLLPGGTALLACAFRPRAAGAAALPLRFTLNGRHLASFDAELTGGAYTPALRFDTPADGAAPLRLRPTCAGGASLRALDVINPSPLPVDAEWEVPPELAALIAPAPARFSLAGRERATITWTFSPDAPGDWAASVPIALRLGGSGSGVSGGGGGAAAVVRQSLSLAARVTPCALRAEPRALDAGTLPLGGAAPLAVTLHNDGDAPVAYSWRPSEPPGALTPDAPSGVLAPRESRAATLTLACRVPGAASARIGLAIVGAGGAAGEGATSALIVEATSFGTAPSLRVVDAAAPGLPPCAAWRHLGVDALNVALAAAAIAAEADGMLPSGAPPHELHVGVAAPGAPPSTVYLWLENCSDVEASWALRLSHETEVTPERWVKAALPEEADAADAVALSLFDAAPRAGSLLPGARVRVAFAYAHDAPGGHVATARLTLGSGGGLRGVPLRLAGRTLRGAASPALRGPGVGGAAGRTLRATLAPQPIGALEPRLQSVTLRSASSKDAQYVLDTSPLDAAAAASFGFPVLTCLNPTGWLPARGAVALHFAHRPIEEGPLALALPLLLLTAPDDPDAPAGAAASVAASDAGTDADGVARSVGGVSAAVSAGTAAAAAGGDGAAAEMALLELDASAFNPLKGVPAAASSAGAQDGGGPGRAKAAVGDAPPAALPGQLGAASPAALRLGVLRPRGVASASVTLSPAAGGAPPLRYRWELEEGALPGGATLTVVPQSGRLPSGGVTCAVTLTAGDAPALLATALRVVFEPVAPPARGAPKRTLPALPADDEEVFAEHGVHLGRPLMREPRVRTSVLKTATIASALKHPTAMRDMLPAAAPPAARVAAQPDAPLPASVAGVVLVAVFGEIESEEALAERAAAAAARATSYDSADEYEEEEAEEADAAAEEAAAAAAAEADEAADAFDAEGALGDAAEDDEDDDDEDEDYDPTGGAVRPSTSSTVAAGDALDDMLRDEFDDGAGGGAAGAAPEDQPEEADAAALAAGAEFLDMLEAALEEGGAAEGAA